MPDQGWATARKALQADVRRVTDRLRGLTESRLATPVPPFSSRAAAAREAARTLAVAAQGLEARRDGDEPVWRTPPTLSDVAVGDQVAVTGNDLLAALADVRPADPVWAPGGRRPAGEVVAEAAELLAATRRLL